MTTILQMTGVSVGLGNRPVLRDVSLCVPRGSVTVLLGHNGAGKSTLLRTALGLHRPRAGQVLVAGIDARRFPRAVRERTGYVPDRLDAPGWMTARELLRFLAPQYPDWNRDTVTDACLELRVVLDRPFRDLSRGEATCALVAAAVSAAPDLLLLDEPFAGLDCAARDRVLQSILGYDTPRPPAILVATHDLHTAARIADRLILLVAGQVQASGTLQEVLGERDEPRAVPRALARLLATGANTMEIGS